MTPQEIHTLKERQKKYFNAHKTIPLPLRKQALRRLKKSIQNHEKDIMAALKKDLGKSTKEAYITEVGLVYCEIRTMQKKLDSMAESKWTWTPLHEFPSVSETVRVPYGNVLILSPWNYPFLLTMQPLVDALAAGNTLMLKPSDYSREVSLVMEEIITECFIPDYVCVIQGGREENQSLLDEEFDYIFFTGSKAVGHVVMEKAAAHLTPMTLELGGKSPCIVDETANLALAARRIVFGKFLNAGQTCVAPDYVCVHASIRDDFLRLLKMEIRRQYPSPDDIGKIINEKHFERLKGLVDPDKVVYGGRASAPTLQIEPTVMDDVSWDDPVMQEEIFGPILPVLTYENYEDLISTIQKRPTPLAFYLFTRNTRRIADWKYVLPFGGGCLNDTVIQLSNDHLPFGGMGASGMGQYHGKYGFDTFSHIKGLLSKKEWLDLPMRYNNRKDRLSFRLIRMFLH